MVMSSITARIKLPTREQLLANRLLRPFAHRLAHPLLWHFNRRSIARGVALGLFAGFLIPLGQTPVAAALALSARANVIIAAFATFVTNPLTFPPIYFAAYKLGSQMLGESPAFDGDTLIRKTMAAAMHFGAPTAIGLFIFAVLGAALGFGAVHMVWRIRVSRKWRLRARARLN
jgi:uncharacterized protein (DUF2062 family)